MEMIKVIAKEMEKLLNNVKKDPDLKERLIKTEKATDPMAEFCKECQAMGYDITIGGIIELGQNMNDAKMRSVNGGGAWEIEGWDDAFEDFLNQIKYC
jgi:hypothetical protein